MSEIGPVELIGIGLIVGYIAWLVLFFSVVRDRLMAAIGRRLRVEVKEEMGGLASGAYEVVGKGAPVAKVGAVWLADAAVLLLGTVGVAALVFTPTFLVAESGATDPIYRALTGRRVTFAAPALIPLSAARRSTTTAIAVRNDGSQIERQCQVSTADYTARNGYLNGRTALFDLPPGAERGVEASVDAARPIVGAHVIRWRLECANRRLMAQEATVQVSP
jgi:hypothetical protein